MAKPDRKHRSLAVFLGSWALLAVLSGMWAISTPIGAAPDEPAHLIKAASVVRGQLVGAPGPQGSVVQVPLYVAYTQAETCYAFVPDQPADCIPEVPAGSEVIVDATTTAGLYNPLYYAMVGWPSLVLHDNKGIFAMRVIGALVATAFIALSLTLVLRWRRPALPVIGLLGAVTPMVLFLAGTVNPNSVEISATLAAFVGMLTVVRDEQVPLRVVAAIVLVASAIAANMRGLSLLWLAFALLCPLVLLSRERLGELIRRRPVQVAIGGVLITAAAAGVWLLASNSLGAGIENDSNPTPGVGTSPVLGFAWTLFSTLDYAQGIVGIFGWLDTPASPFVYFVWALIAGGLLTISIVFLRGRARLLAVLLTSALLLLPAILQGIYIERGGVIWQGRYILPVFVCAVVAGATLLADRIALNQSDSTALLVVVASLWDVAQFQSFAIALKRYAVGYHSGWLELLSPHWTPPGGIFVPLALFGMTVALCGAGTVVLGRRLPAASTRVTA